MAQSALTCGGWGGRVEMPTILACAALGVVLVLLAVRCGAGI